MELVAKAAPDGYTLLMASNGIATNMALFPHLAFDGQRDFVPVAKIGYAPLVIVVPASSPAKSLKDLIAMAKAEPGKLTYASAGNGSSGHLAGELLQVDGENRCAARSLQGRRAGDHRPSRRAYFLHADQSGRGHRAYPRRPPACACGRERQALRAAARRADRRRGGPRRLRGLRLVGLWSRPRRRPPRSSGSSTPKPTRRSRIQRTRTSSPSWASWSRRARSEQFAAFVKAQTELWSGVIKSAGIRPD